MTPPLQPNTISTEPKKERENAAARAQFASSTLVDARRRSSSPHASKPHAALAYKNSHNLEPTSLRLRFRAVWFRPHPMASSFSGASADNADAMAPAAAPNPPPTTTTTTTPTPAWLTAFSYDETCRFDPTTVGLPLDFCLTDWSTLKG